MEILFIPLKIALARKALGLTQEELARRAGLSHSTICLLEAGKKVPLANTLAKVAVALGKNPGFFFGK